MKDVALDNVKVGDELLCTAMGGGLRRVEVTAVSDGFVECGEREYRRSDGRHVIGDDTGTTRCFIPTEAQWLKFRIDNLAANLRTLQVDESNYALVEDMLNTNAMRQGHNFTFTERGLRFVRRASSKAQLVTRWQNNGF